VVPGAGSRGDLAGDGDTVRVTSPPVCALGTDTISVCQADSNAAEHIAPLGKVKYRPRMRRLGAWALLPVFAACTAATSPGSSGTLGLPAGTSTGDFDPSTTGATSETGGVESTSGLGTTTGGAADESTEDGAIFDLGVPDMPPVDQCLRCEIDLMTTQSNALTVDGASPLFATAELDGETVFGLGEVDAGRIAFSGDGNVIYREGTCPLWEWLGDTGASPPRVLCIGADWPCGGLTETKVVNEINHLHMYPGQLDYGGLTLPPEYEGDPVALHDDYDVVVYFAVLDFATNGWDYDPGDVATLESFARDEGGGLYLIAEYWGGGMGQAQLDSINAIAAPYDVSVQQQSLAWGPAGAAVELDCFPNPEG